jgi:hypothetical protein
MIDGNKVKLFCRGLFSCGKVQYTQLIVMDEAKKACWTLARKNKIRYGNKKKSNR